MFLRGRPGGGKKMFLLIQILDDMKPPYVGFVLRNIEMHNQPYLDSN